MIDVDESTRRLGRVLAAGFGLQFLVHVTQLTFDVLTVAGIVLALLLPTRLWARSGLLALGLFAGLLIALWVARGGHAPLGVVNALLALAVLPVYFVAVAFAIDEMDPAWLLPEGWRPWATSTGMHVVLFTALVLGAVGIGLRF